MHTDPVCNSDYIKSKPVLHLEFLKTVQRTLSAQQIFRTFLKINFTVASPNKDKNFPIQPMTCTHQTARN